MTNGEGRILPHVWLIGPYSSRLKLVEDEVTVIIKKPKILLPDLISFSEGNSNK